jgi:hypothetical protein
MFLRFNANSQEMSMRRLRQNGVSVEGPEGSFEVIESGVQLNGFVPSTETGELQSQAVITVRKNCLLVSLNPDLGALLGYQPAAPQILYAGEFSQLVVNTQGLELDDLAELAKLPWLARLHYVVVGNFQ